MDPIESQTILITGATDGLGLAVATSLASEGARLILHGRDPDKLGRVREQIAGASGNRRLETAVADLASLDAVRALADEVAGSHDRLHVLVNNAGIARSGARTETADGYESHLGVNHLSHFLLTSLLLDRLALAAPARIVNVSSLGQAPLDFDDPQLERGEFDFSHAYCVSKLAQVGFTFELAERLPDDVTVNALHPATFMDTKMVHESFDAVHTTVEQGRDATLALITDPELDGVSGRFYDGRSEARAHAQAYDPQARSRLWELSERLTGARYPG